MADGIEIEQLCRSNVKMRDPRLVGEKINKLIIDGHSQLQIIADFDSTLSKFHTNGKRCPSTYNAIGSHPKAPEFYRHFDTSSKEKYLPIERDPKLTTEQKMPFMHEWWSLARKNLCETKLRQSDIILMARESGIVLRDGCSSFLQMLQEKSVLLTILSAGLGDVLEEVIRNQAEMHENINIISNFMIFDESGHICGFKGELIYTYNKNTALTNLDCHSECLRRPNVILLGDSVGDSNMDAGLTSVEVSLKIGFLNDHIESRLDEYLNNFDIVLLNDQTMDIVNAILRKIF